VAVVRNRGGLFDAPGLDREFDVIAFSKDLASWKDGVRLGVKPNARHSNHEFSGTKVLSWSMNLTWLEESQRAGFDEVLLLDEQGWVSECTSANVFLVKGDQVWTPPLSCGCLPGVTRALLLEEIRVAGISVEERAFTMEELAAADDVFITSSTRDLLGVSEAGGMPLAMKGEVRSKLNAAFQGYLQAYVERVRSPITETVPR
jgi:branched-chain amino acid aminotransferase